MKADDPILQEQLHHICTSARKATSAERIVMMIDFYDDEKNAPCTMMVFDSKEDVPPAQEVARVVITALAGVNSMLESMTKLRMVIQHTETGEIKPFSSFDAEMVELTV